MVNFKVPFGMKCVFQFVASYFPNLKVLPVSWRQLAVMCWVRWRKRNSPFLPEILEQIYWESLPQSMQNRALSQASQRAI
jgi:hypothetical protein